MREDRPDEDLLEGNISGGDISDEGEDEQESIELEADVVAPELNNTDNVRLPKDSKASQGHTTTMAKISKPHFTPAQEEWLRARSDTVPQYAKSWSQVTKDFNETFGTSRTKVSVYDKAVRMKGEIHSDYKKKLWTSKEENWLVQNLLRFDSAVSISRAEIFHLFVQEFGPTRTQLAFVAKLKRIERKHRSLQEQQEW